MAEDQNPADDALDPEDGPLDDLEDLEFDDPSENAEPAPADPDGSLEEADLDDLVDDVPAAAAPADAEAQTPAAADVAGDGTPAAATDDGTLAALAGDGLGRLMDFSTRLTDVFHVGIESVTGRNTSLSGAHIAPTTFEAVAGTFTDVPHVALRLKLAFSESESAPLIALMPLADAGHLVQLETAEDEFDDVDFADRQLDMIATAVRELLDLMSLALFTDSLMGAEMTLIDFRMDAADDILSMAAAELGDDAVRLDVALALPGGEAAGLALVMSPELVTRFVGELSTTPRAATAPAPRSEPPPVTPPAPDAPEVSGPAEHGPAFGFEAGNVSPIRPAGPARPRAGDDVDVHPVRFPTIGEPPTSSRTPRSLELLMDVEMRVSVELGRASMSVEEILSLGPGSVVELNKLAGEPVDILVNDHLIARGEVVVVDENFGVRVTEILSATRRVHMMAR